MRTMRIPGVIGVYDHKSQTCRESTIFDLYRPKNELTYLFASRGPMGVSFASDQSATVGAKPSLDKGMYDDEAVKQYAKSTEKAQYIKGNQIYLLQKQLKEFGFVEVGVLDGDYGKKTETAVRNFQIQAKNQKRMKMVGGKEEIKDVETTFCGSINGKVDSNTWKEIEVWKTKQYRIAILKLGNYKYQCTRLTLQECLDTLPSQLRSAFKKNITTVITKMHEIGFSFGSWPAAKSGYRTFQQQYDIPPKSTKAGPGESFHNYGLAVDLGSLNWVDKDGNSYNKDFWLGKMKPSAFASAVWKKRNDFAPKSIYTLSWETIHMQGVPAKNSGMDALIKCLNAVTGESADHNKWKYARGAGSTYKCTLGSDNPVEWTNIGTAKQMWSKNSPNCTNAQKDVIKSHMTSAETKALTITIP